MKPALLVIAGPNGAGKTTVTVRLRVDHWSEGVEYLNPDEIARDRFGDWNSPSAVLEAARWVTQRREELSTCRATRSSWTCGRHPRRRGRLDERHGRVRWSIRRLDAVTGPLRGTPRADGGGRRIRAAGGAAGGLTRQLR